MIIEGLFGLIYDILDFVLFFEIPSLPQEVRYYCSIIDEYLQTGASIISIFAPFQYLLVLAGVIIAVDIGINIYHLVMWILRKIPMLGIE